MKQKHNIHKIVCNFVEANGPQTFEDLHRVVLVAAGRNLSEHSWGVSYLDSVSPASVQFPKKDDRRHIAKGEDGLYHLVKD